MQDSAAVTKRGNRRLVIVGLLCVALAVQGRYALFADREPFPAIVMPGFGTSSNGYEHSTTLLNVSVEYDDGTIVMARQEELMRGFRFSSVGASIDYMFDPERNPDAASPPTEVVDWLRDRAVILGDGAKPESVTFCWRKTLIDLSNAATTPTEECRTTVVQL